MKNMRTKQLTFLSLLAGLLILAGCADKNEVPRGKYAVGVMVVNEGNFGDSDGSIDFYDPATSSVTQDIYGIENEVQTSGVFQSINFNGNYGYLIDQVGHKITVVEAETFKHVSVIDAGLNTPRYMVVANNKGYVSNWGDFDTNFDLPDSYVAVIDLTNFVVLKSIPVGNGAEGLVVFGGNVYVANAYSNTIQVIDTGNDTVVSAFEVANGPLQFAEDHEGKHWVLSSSWQTGASLSQIDFASEEVLKTFEIAGSAKSLAINSAGTELYYLSAPFGADGEVYAVFTSASEAPAEPIITAPNLYGLGVDPGTDQLYLANHNAFQGNGTVLRYQRSGTLIEDFAAGRVPNGFVFRK
jgi:YVTN family beta-propeller protein